MTGNNSYQYLWNDPGIINGMHHSERGFDINTFGPDIVKNFLFKNGFDRIVRSHQFKYEGYEWMFKGKLLTIFSSLNYCGRENKGAFAVYESGNLTLCLFGEE